MGRILVVEGNTPDVLTKAAAVGVQPAAERFAATFQALAPGLEIRIARPFHPGFDAAALPVEDVDGAVLTGSGVSFAADAAEAAPARAAATRVFAAGLPVWGSCWGVHLAAVIAGGAVRASPNGIETPIAHAVAPTDAGRAHAMFAGKRAPFDTVCIHRDEVSRPPSDAVVLASNAHSEVQAMAIEAGGVRFWGAQYHPELTLGDIADYLSRPGENVLAAEERAKVSDLRAIMADPEGASEGTAAARRRRGVSDEALDVDGLTRELRNWLVAHRLGVDAVGVDGLGAPASAEDGVEPG